MAAPKNGSLSANGSMIPLASAITVMMLFVSTISWLAWSVTNTNLDRIEKRVQAVEAQFVRIREHDEFTKRLDSQILKMEARLTEAATRPELDTRLGINSASIIQVRGDLDVIKRDLGQTYNVKDALAAYKDSVNNIQARLDRIEQWSRAPPPSSKP